MTPPVRDSRIYIGEGSKQGISESVLVDALQRGGLTREQIKRFVIRDAYSFADVPEELANNVVSQLSEVPQPDGRKLFACKAVTISAPRENGRQGGDEGQEAGPVDSMEGGEQPNGGAEDEGEQLDNAEQP
jgi:hypothetical protein